MGAGDRRGVSVALVLDRPGAAPTRPLRVDDRRGPRAGCRGGPAPGRGVRRVPHRPAAGGGRPAGPPPARRPRPPGRRPGRGCRRGRERPRSWATAWAWPGSPGPAARCRFCRRGRENLCEQARFTGWDRDGGFAELRHRSSRLHPPPPRRASTPPTRRRCSAAEPSGTAASPVGRRGAGQRLGLYGFGASATCVIQVAVHTGCEVYVVHPLRRGAGAGPGARCRVGRRLRRAPAGRAGRRHHVRAGRVGGGGGPGRRRPGRRGRRQRHPPRPHPRVPLRAPLVGAPDPQRRQRDPRTTCADCSSWPPPSRSAPGPRSSRCDPPTRRSARWPPVSCRARRCSCPEVGLRPGSAGPSRPPPHRPRRAAPASLRSGARPPGSRSGPNAAGFEPGAPSGISRPSRVKCLRQYGGMSSVAGSRKLIGTSSKTGAPPLAARKAATMSSLQYSSRSPGAYPSS